jgi:hypothetical protein
VQAEVVEEQVKVKGLPVDFERNLAADKGEAAPQFKQQIAQVLQQPTLQFALARVRAQSQKIKMIRVF